MIGKHIKEQAALWDLQFTYRVHQLQPDQATLRVANAWLAGYQAAQRAARQRSAADAVTP
jgi:hypothetical protein